MTPGWSRTGSGKTRAVRPMDEGRSSPVISTHVSVCILGGLFDEAATHIIEADSIGGTQAAADALQWNLVRGLDEALGHPVSLVTAPFVGSFPMRYRKPLLRRWDFAHASGACDVSVGFVNLPLVKHFSRLVNAWRELRDWVVRTPGTKVVVSYSMNFAFMKCLERVKRLEKSVVTCLVVPDLPEFMNTTTKQSWAYRVLKRGEIKTMEASFHAVDCLVLLTEQMRARLPAGPPHIVLEGIATDIRSHSEPGPLGPRTVLYAGTLNARYGILDLLEAFRNIDDPEIRLQICGSGDSESAVEAAAAQDPRIEFLGRLPRQKALELQANATILVNPRNNLEEFAKYSFPSKILEYMSVGRPVVAFALDGMPAEYRDYLMCVPEEESLADTIRAASTLSDEELDEIGARARYFVLGNKGARHQAERLLTLVRDAADGNA